MSNSYGKVFVVFVAAASMAFAAFAAAMRNGGPNWMAEVNEFGNEFTLSVTSGEAGTTYQMTHRQSNSAVGDKTKNLAEAVTAARTKQVQVARDELTKTQAEIDKHKPNTEAALSKSDADEQALLARANQLLEQLNALSQRISRTNDEIIAKTTEAQRIRGIGQERREEAYRLGNQLELLRNDLYAANLQRKHLEEEEVRLTETLERLQRRQQQLSRQNSEPYEASSANNLR